LVVVRFAISFSHGGGCSRLVDRLRPRRRRPELEQLAEVTGRDCSKRRATRAESSSCAVTKGEHVSGTQFFAKARQRLGEGANVQLMYLRCAFEDDKHGR
jgi:hypothetical protein